MSTHPALPTPSISKLACQIFSASELAGQAAVQRLTPEEQEVEDCCGHTEGNKGATAAATAATPAATPTPPVAVDVGDASGSPGPAGERQFVETEVVSLVSEMSVASDDAMDEGGCVGSGAPPPVGGSSSGSGVTNTDALREREAGDQRQGVTAMDVPEAADELPPFPQAEVSMASATPPPAADKPPSPTPPFPSPSQSPVPAPAPPASAAAAPAPTPAAVPASQSPSPLDELLAMGFPRDAAVEALAASGGSIPDAAYRLLTPGMMESNGSGGGTATAAAAGGGSEAGANHAGGGGGSGGGSEGEVRLPRDVRLQHAADRIGGHGDRTRAVQVRISLWDTAASDGGGWWGGCDTSKGWVRFFGSWCSCASRAFELGRCVGMFTKFCCPFSRGVSLLTSGMLVCGGCPSVSACSFLPHLNKETCLVLPFGPVLFFAALPFLLLAVLGRAGVSVPEHNGTSGGSEVSESPTLQWEIQGGHRDFIFYFFA